MNNENAKYRILFLTTYPPRECGIATYSMDLMVALGNRFGNSVEMPVCALNEGNIFREYPEEVIMTMDTTEKENYSRTASIINNDPSIDAVHLQHEFGLFSGECGEDVIELLYTLQKPVFTTLHTILPEPGEKRLSVIQAIAHLSKKITVMTQNSANILMNEYHIDANKIAVIPHGTHPVPWRGKEEMKRKYNLTDRLVLSTFGLISSNKSIETALHALPEIKNKFPNVLYLILGITHPGVVKHEGEKYRESLEQIVKDLGLENNVQFVNRYLTKEELLDYLRLTDIYLFTSKDPHQAVSGTFSYAMASACPIISTAMPHAREMLDESTGAIIDFCRPDQLASEVNRLLGNDTLRENMGRAAFTKTRPTLWSNVAKAYIQLYKKTLEMEEISYSYPPISISHLKTMTDEHGILQFSQICEPDLNSGYTLDDNARAMMVSCRYFKLTGDEKILPYISIYFDFIKSCHLENGFINLVPVKGDFKHDPTTNNQDAHGRTVWALGELISNKDILPASLIEEAEILFRKTLNVSSGIQSPRGIAYTIKGLYYYNLRMHEEEIVRLITMLAQRLYERYASAADVVWIWFENYITYGNSILPEAMMYAYLVTNIEDYRIIAINSFDFLLSHLFKNGHLELISNRGWLHKNTPAPRFGEQPIDAAYLIETLSLFHEVTNNGKYKKMMNDTFSWFLGNNHLGQMLYNEATQGSFDGLEEFEVNINQGAESTVVYLMARITMEMEFIREKIPCL